MSELIGVDLSHHNTIASYAKLTAGADFVVHKATEGATFIDPTFTSRMARLRAAGGRLGSYHFASGGDPAGEAALFLRVARPRPGEMIMLDVEAKMLARPELPAWCRSWFTAARTDGCVLALYVQHSAILKHDWRPVAELGVVLWAARYAKSAPAAGAFGWWSIWQYTSKGAAAGVTGYVDLNRTNGDPWNSAPKPAPAPAPAAAPTPSPAGSYTVQRGDTLSAIAVAHGTTWRQLVAWNRDRYPQLTGNPNLIQPGWRLVVKPGAPAPHAIHMIRPGETLSAIAAAHETTIRALVEANQGRYPSLVSNPDLVRPGWVLYLP